MVPTLVAVPGKTRQRFVLIPPPPDRSDLLSIVELGKAAEVVHRWVSNSCWNHIMLRSAMPYQSHGLSTQYKGRTLLLCLR